jgi:thiol-disulfide isomerase/thioredoxin
VDRFEFLSGVLAAAAAAASPAPSASPSIGPWDLCDKSTALPYDHPLDFKLEVLDGPDFELSKYRGTSVLINIFATWCGPCNHEQPALVAAAQKYAASGLAVIGVNSAEQDDDVRRYRKKYGITYPIAMDRRGGMVRALEVGTSDKHEMFPVSLFIDPDGYLYCMQIGGMGADELTYRIERFLAAAPPSTIRTETPSPSPPSRRR